MTTHLADSCGSCGLPFEADAERVTCSACGKVYHAACWQANGECKTLGCLGFPIAQATAPAATPPAPLPMASSIPPPPPGKSPLYYATQSSAKPGEVSLDVAFSAGWAAFTGSMGLAIGVCIVYGMLQVPGQIPYIGFLYPILVASVFKGGLYRFFMRIVRTWPHVQDPDIGDLFSGFSEYGKWLGMYGVWALIALVAMIPLLVGVIVAISMIGLTMLGSLAQDHDPAHISQLFTALGVTGIMILVLSALLSAGLGVYAQVRWFFSYFAAADGYEVWEAFRRSEELTEGRRMQLLGIGIVFTLLLMVSAIMLLIPLVFAIPFSLCAQAALYKSAKGEEPTEIPLATGR